MSDLNPPPPTPWHQPPTPPQFQPPQPPKRRRNGRTIALVIGGTFVVLIGIGVAAGAASSKPHHHASNPPATTATTQPAAAPAPAPAPSPDATYQGACDYTLGNDPVDGTAVATGDIQLTNDGNIGVVVVLRITWPQQGYNPLGKTKVVRIAAGASQDVQFNRPLSGTELDNLQNWQTGHNFDDGCTYKATIINEFGSVSG